METVFQLTIALLNSPNALAKVGDRLRAAEVNIIGLSCTEGSPSSKIHLIVDDPETAKIVLKDLGPITTEEILVFHMKNKPGAIASIARDFAIANINIRNIWATTQGKEGTIYVVVDNPEDALHQLQNWRHKNANLA